MYWQFRNWTIIIAPGLVRAIHFSIQLSVSQHVKNIQIPFEAPLEGSELPEHVTIIQACSFILRRPLARQ